VTVGYPQADGVCARARNSGMSDEWTYSYHGGPFVKTMRKNRADPVMVIGNCRTRSDVLNAKFSQYRVPRFKDVPEIETVLVNRPDLVSVGAGETPIIGIAPAVANALYNATQTRIRSLPIRDSRFRAVG